MAKRTHHALASLAAAATLMFGGIASGAFYSSSFDPPGPIDFSGTGLFFVSDACTSQPGFHTAAECGLRLDTATIDMTDTVSGDTGHLDFAPVLSDTVDMVSLFMGADGQLLGVNTDLIGWTFASPCTGTLCGIPWWIQWQFNFDDPVYLYAGSCDTEINTVDTRRVAPKAIGPCSPFSDPAGVALTVTFTRVPEPGTLALLVSALGAGWLARRRKTH